MLQWLYTTNLDSLICVHMTYEKDYFTTEIYGKKDEGVKLSDYDNSRGYIINYHITGEDRIIPNDTIIYDDADITMNMRLPTKPTWWEINIRKLKRRIKRIIQCKQ